MYFNFVISYTLVVMVTDCAFVAFIAVTTM